MVQFKNELLGITKPETARAASCQLCMRAGGKHNDLENVGYTARHHTLFEMLGNFSFGDYFKEEAIEWAWRFVIEVLEMDSERIWITTHPSDDEARDLWVNKIGIKPDRVVPHEENFWEMGPTGPCGPNTEIFLDQGPGIQGGPPGSPDEDGDRFLEFWNLVFPQYDRQPDGSLQPLKAPGVDTGLGLERTVALKQNVSSNYGIDLFANLMSELARLVGMRDPEKAIENPSIRVIVDHIRSSAFLISDGVLPSNEGRGYVLRRIIRRALRHGHKLGMQEAFFNQLVSPLVDAMGCDYPTFAESASRIRNVLLKEEEKFASTLRFGMNLLENEFAKLSSSVVPGEVAFKLYDTYGFPFDLTQSVARERALTVNESAFESLMEAQRARARSASKFDSSWSGSIEIDSEVEFDGYQNLEGNAQVLALLATNGGDAKSVDELNTGQKGAVVLDRTEFYGEGGGQVGDSGWISSNGFEFRVKDTQAEGSQLLHWGTVQTGNVYKQDRVRTKVDAIRRQDIARNHTGTHLLHAALRKILGSQVSQRGSLVAPDHLRFDFSHDGPVTASEIEQIEDSVNEQIALNTDVETRVVPYEEALSMGAIALFGEKYGDFVRVLTVGNGYSVEFCGGTHVAATGEIGSLRIVSESGIAAGVRRIEAVTGRRAHTRSRNDDRTIGQLAELLGTSRDDLAQRVVALLQERLELRKSLEQTRSEKHRELGKQLVADAIKESGISIVVSRIEGDPRSMLSVYDDVRQTQESYVIALATVLEGKVHLLCGVSKNLTSRNLSAAELVGHVGSQVGARGGGKPEMARAGGGTQIDALPKALNSVRDWVRQKLQ